MTTTAPLDWETRLEAFLATHPEADRTGVLHTAACATCGVAMEDRLNAARTDHGWHVAGRLPEVDHWAEVDRLRAEDVAAYSAAVAHRGLAGAWPWEHNHHPDPASIRANR